MTSVNDPGFDRFWVKKQGFGILLGILNEKSLNWDGGNPITDAKLMQIYALSLNLMKKTSRAIDWFKTNRGERATKCAATEVVHKRAFYPNV